MINEYKLTGSSYSSDQEIRMREMLLQLISGFEELSLPVTRNTAGLTASDKIILDTLEKCTGLRFKIE